MEDYIVKTGEDSLLLDKRDGAETDTKMDRLAAYRKMTEEQENE